MSRIPNTPSRSLPQVSFPRLTSLNALGLAIEFIGLLESVTTVKPLKLDPSDSEPESESEL